MSWVRVPPSTLQKSLKTKWFSRILLFIYFLLTDVGMLINYSSTHTNTLGFVHRVRPPHLVMFMFRSLVLKFLNYNFVE